MCYCTSHEVSLFTKIYIYSNKILFSICILVILILESNAKPSSFVDLLTFELIWLLELYHVNVSHVAC